LNKNPDWFLEKNAARPSNSSRSNWVEVMGKTDDGHTRNKRGKPQLAEKNQIPGRKRDTLHTAPTSNESKADTEEGQGQPLNP